MDLLEQLTALGDQYRVERELGHGGMAVVFLAEDLKYRRRVAIKLLKPAIRSIL
jgi:serine/threonine-protein kinase